MRRIHTRRVLRRHDGELRRRMVLLSLRNSQPRRPRGLQSPARDLPPRSPQSPP
ncbi:hypothetical protein F2Q68_00032911 [Brassica cretica]|uniref:Uncharacterized protein n=2 Tax=Brassica cretica TaxID=69181 RepID=A0A8S9GGW2_BRACR|nr:hypothetical protein F2Q68_00032911 [Brassica cretica]KAF3533784.1 hypothetical protein DY000_02043403 [Brassica cretica]